MKMTFIAGALLLLSACAAEPWTPATGAYVFVSNSSGNNEIYIIDKPDAPAVNISNHPENDNWPVWSPDGRRLAFQSRRNGNLDVFVVNADGTNLAQLTDDPAHDYVPSWSPDGERIYFLSWRLESGDSEPAPHFYGMSADGENQYRMIAATPNTSGALAPSPDGAAVAYTRRAAGEEGASIILRDLETGTEQILAESLAYLGAPAFSPDGQRIAYYEDNGDQSLIKTMKRDGSATKTILAQGRAWYPQWSPDGRWLLLTVAFDNNDQDLTLGYIAADGSGDLVVIKNDGAKMTEGRWRP